MDTNKRFTQLMQRQGIIVAPGCYDALTAKLIERTGFEALYMTGAGVSISTLGIADIGLTSFTEMVTRVSQISQAVGIPLIADGDTGYGNPLNVYRTVKEYERAGASAIQLEDQEIPKKCGHVMGRKLISIEEMKQKIYAAQDAKTSSDFYIIARTDARTGYGLDEAITRAKAYEDAGADIIFVESLQSEEEMRHFNRSVKKPTFANMVEGGHTPLRSAKVLESIGYKIVIFPNALTRMIAKASLSLLAELKDKGTTEGMLDRMLPHKELFDLYDYPYWAELEAKYLSKK